MNTSHERQGRRRGGFTLIELLVVVFIVILVSAATLPVVLPAINHRQVSEAARLLQATIASARDSALRANQPRGIRLLPDPAFQGPNPLASNRIIAIEPASDYATGDVSVDPSTEVFAVPIGAVNVTQISIVEAVRDASGLVNEPTSWYWNMRQGDKIRFGDSGRYYTIAGPIQIGAYVTPGSKYAANYSIPAGPANVERYINFGPPRYVPGIMLPNGAGSPPVFWSGSTQPATTLNNMDPSATDGSHLPERIYLVNGQDDDGDGWVDEGFDGIDNDGDGVVDPGYNGLDDNGDGKIDEPAELFFNAGGEYEAEAFIGTQFTTPLLSQKYTIFRRPVVSEGAREVALPQGAVIDLTTWNAVAAFRGNAKQPSLPERSRLPVDPYSMSVDIMFSPNGQVIPSGPGQASLNAGTNLASPTSSMPFYHFWIAERDDVQPPLWGIGDASTVAGNIFNKSVPFSNPQYASTPSLQYLLPMPQGTPGYAPHTVAPALWSTDPYLKGERRIVTLFVKSGQILTNEVEVFNASNTNIPYYESQFGMRETK